MQNMSSVIIKTCPKDVVKYPGVDRCMVSSSTHNLSLPYHHRLHARTTSNNSPAAEYLHSLNSTASDTIQYSCTATKPVWQSQFNSVLHSVQQTNTAPWHNVHTTTYKAQCVQLHQACMRNSLLR